MESEFENFSPREFVERERQKNNDTGEKIAKEFLKRYKDKNDITNKKKELLEKRRKEKIRRLNEENARIKRKNLVNKLIQKRLVYRKGKPEKKVTIRFKQSKEPEAYRSLFFK